MSAYNVDSYADIAELLDRGDIKPPVPTVGLRSDGVGVFYREQVNLLFGNPESGKTLIAQCATVDELNRGESALIVDLDHNGAGATISRLIAMGADEEILRDPERFRYCSPDDAEQLALIVADTVAWQPAVVLLDSLGELLPLCGASSNSPDDFSRVHADILKPLAKSGAAVIVIDHLAKNTDSQAFGSTGTAAKKRAIGGTSLRTTVVDAFKPGSGGKAQLTINKDRHGGLRAASGGDDREPIAATFKMWDENGDIRWTFIPPVQGERAVVVGVSEADIVTLSELLPVPASQRDVKERLGWGSTRSLEALREWRRRGEPTTVLPAPQPPMWGAEEHSEEHPEALLPERTRSSNTEENISAPRSPHRGLGSKEHSEGALL
ncbi:hypothetical protein QMG61_15225 [Cryobacterium sp. PH31-AA6]|uniref:hypothetical protein n=1 Tax=Cryobacterium sp. PH31-AA6 TaxID=3046205 RepID=UPI0024B971A3|nr:hypothetical protein [Cryobacterium sp. PH31-AA6]MDJ0325116.1 hypothetical protein [Cryobacterium sp. PH31-AA6]